MKPPLTLWRSDVRRISDIYAGKYGIVRDDDWYLLKLQEELGELTAGHLRLSSRGRGEACGTTAPTRPPTCCACCCSTAAASASTRTQAMQRQMAAVAGAENRRSFHLASP